MRPTFSNVFLQEIKKDLKTASGIILTQDVEAGNKPGMVVACGPDCTQVKPGDTAYVNWKEAIPVTVDGTMGVLVPETAILGVK